MRLFSRTTFILGFIVLFGFFQVLDAIKTSNRNPRAIEKWVDDDLNPYSIRGDRRTLGIAYPNRRPKNKKMARKKLTPSISKNPSIDLTKKDPKAKAADADKDKSKEKVADKDKDKDKKEGKADLTNPVDVAIDDENPVVDDANPSGETGTPDDDSQVAPDLFAANQTPSAKDGIPTTLEEWEVLLLTNPNKDATRDFIRYSQVNLIEDSIFFPIAQKMVLDSRQAIQEMGITILGSNISYMSFVILTETRTEFGYESKLRPMLENKINQYASIKGLIPLNFALRSEGQIPDTTAWAIKLVRITADKFLEATPSENLDSGNAAPPSTQEVTAINNPNRKHFVTILEQLLVLSGIESDPNIAHLADDTLAHINDLLNENA